MPFENHPNQRCLDCAFQSYRLGRPQPVLSVGFGTQIVGEIPTVSTPICSLTFFEISVDPETYNSCPSYRLRDYPKSGIQCKTVCAKPQKNCDASTCPDYAEWPHGSTVNSVVTLPEKCGLGDQPGTRTGEVRCPHLQPAFDRYGHFDGEDCSLEDVRCGEERSNSCPLDRDNPGKALTWRLD